jgi:WD40 repeat protein
VHRQVTCDKLPGDVSVMTYTGHKVQHTLIRSRFSPPASTGERYIYTGGSGSAVIYDILTGEMVLELPVSTSRRGRARTVRDISWHPYRPHIVTSGVSLLGVVCWMVVGCGPMSVACGCGLNGVVC